MEEDTKKIAAMAAVMAYIKSEEEAIAMQVATAPGADRPAPAGVANLWGIGGRQAMMQMRSMMQLKTFHRFPPR